MFNWILRKTVIKAKEVAIEECAPMILTTISIGLILLSMYEPKKKEIIHKSITIINNYYGGVR
jgi:hypothetical protein